MAANDHIEALTAALCAAHDALSQPNGEGVTLARAILSSAIAGIDAGPDPAPIAGRVVSIPDGVANTCTLLRVDPDGREHWLAAIRWNGELLVARQEQMTGQIVAALNEGASHAP